MTGSKNISNSFKTAFHAVRNANVARRTTRKTGNLQLSSVLPKSAVINFHAVGPIWTGKPTITLRLSNRHSTPQLYCFNLTPSIDRHRRVSRSKPSGFFLTSTDWDNMLRSSMVFFSRKITHLSKDDKLPFSGPPGFSDCMKNVIKTLQMPHFSRQFLNRFNLSDSDDSYKTDSIEISKIIANPMSECSHDTNPTASYICDICFDLNEVDDSSQLEMDKVSKECDYKNDVSHNAIAILDCPTVPHFNQIKTNRLWTDYHMCQPQKQISAIIHLTPNDVFNSVEYQNWIDYFGTDCKHLIVNQTSLYAYSVKDYEHISKLHKLCPMLFPSADVDESRISQFDQIEENIYKVDGRMELSLRADSCIMYNDESRVQEGDVALTGLRWSEISHQYCGTLDKFHTNVKDLKTPECPGYFPSISVLGSGSVHDNMLRAQPAFLLRLDKENSILLDCGEQTLERINQMFGDSANEVLASIKLILLSHRHLDHHAGFQCVIDAIIRSGGGQEHKVYCLMPGNVHPIYRDVVGDQTDFVELCLLTNQNGEALSKYKADEIVRQLPIKSIVPVRVDHNIITFGIVIVTSCGKKIAYSSDTVPMSRQLIKYGYSADLLIHDCLYVEEGMETEAEFRKHGHLNGAIATSDAMFAKFLLLTHFAPQYPLLPFEYLPEKYASKLSPAVDFLSVSLSDLHKLPILMTTLEEIYSNKLTRGRARSNSMYLRRVSRNDMVEKFSSLFEINN